MSSATLHTDKQYRADWGLFLITLILLSFGVVMVYDASYPNGLLKHHGDGLYWMKQQLRSVALGMVALYVGSRVRYWKWQAWAIPAFVFSFLLLVAVAIMGHRALGGQRWLHIGPIPIQPSEFAKLGLVLFMAHLIAVRPQRVQNFWTGIFPPLLFCLMQIGMVERQPDLGTAITMLLSLLFVLFAGGAKKRWVLGILAACATIALALILVKGTENNFRLNRLTTFLNPAADPLRDGYQITHSTIALGTGGVTGLGFGESREKQGTLPAERTDFIFAIVGEEFGLAGTCSVLIAFVFFAARGLDIAHRTKDPFGSLLALGITSMVSVQALVNIGVVTASIPTTGIPLPFISFGGSSLVPTLFGIGILLNISQHPFRRDMRPSARRLRGEGNQPDPQTVYAPPSGTLRRPPAPSPTLRPAPVRGGSASVARGRLVR